MPVTERLRRAGSAALRLPRRALRGWRRSIMFRVVSATLVLSAVVLVLVGQLVLTGVRDGLVDAKVAASLAQAEVGFATAETRLETAESSTQQANVSQLLTQVVTQLEVQSGQPRQYEIVMIPAPTSGGATAGRGSRTTVGVQLASVPPMLPADLDRAPGVVSYRFTRICHGAPGPCPADGRAATPGLVVGKQLRIPDGGSQQLYFLFPMTQEEKTLNLVRGRLAAGGALLSVLLGAIAFLVTRGVVRPVRSAARVAERLSAGRLEERMVERGEDDLARLASSFNEMASALQRQIRQLEELSRMQRRFVSDVSHELRTPLTTIRMAADVLHEARETFRGPVARSAELMHDQLDRFESLLAELLEISRFDAGAAVLEPEPTDLAALIRGVVESVEAVSAGQYRSSILLEVPERACLVEVDARRIERILRNLLLNALEHGEGHQIRVRLVADARAVAVAVRDYGVGLRPGDASQVFDRFWRADPARARRSGGTGLGLSIAQEDAHLHSGTLQAWGEPGGGAHFVLTLPRTVAAPLISAPIPLQPTDRRSAGGLASPARPRPTAKVPDV